MERSRRKVVRREYIKQSKDARRHLYGTMNVRGVLFSYAERTEKYEN